MPLRCALSRLLPIIFRLSGFETAAPAADRESRTSLLAGRSANRPVKISASPAAVRCLANRFLGRVKQQLGKAPA